MIRHPLSSTGSPSGRIPLLHRYYGMLRLPAARPAALRCLRLAVPRPRRCLSCPTLSRSNRSASHERSAWGLVRRLPHSGFRRGDDRASQVPGEPHCGHALLFDPDGTVCARPLRRDDAAFRGHDGVGSRDSKFFRGSITRPVHSLSTLRSPDYSRTTQDSLPAVGLLCRAGLATRWVPLQGLAFHNAPPRPGFAWRTVTKFWGTFPIASKAGQEFR